MFDLEILLLKFLTNQIRQNFHPEKEIEMELPFIERNFRYSLRFVLIGKSHD